MDVASNITVLTSTIVGRERFLDSMKDSIAKQTLLPYTHLIRVNLHPEVVKYGESIARMLDGVETEWIHITADDDIYNTDFYASCEEFTHRPKVGIIYTDFTCEVYNPVPPGSIAAGVLFRIEPMIINPLVRVEALKPVLDMWLSNTEFSYAGTWLGILKGWEAVYIDRKLWKYGLHRDMDSFRKPNKQEIADGMAREKANK